MSISFEIQKRVLFKGGRESIALNFELPVIFCSFVNTHLHLSYSLSRGLLVKPTKEE